MKRKMAKLLVLSAVALVAYLLVLLAQCAFGRQAPALAKLLPEDTLVWLSVRDTDSLIATFGGEAPLAEFLGMLAEESDARESFEERFGEELNEKTAAKLVKWFKDIRALDVVFDGVAIRRGGPVPRLTVMLEFASRGAAADTQKKLDRIFTEKDNRKDTAICRADPDLADEMDGLEPCIAVHGKRLLFALDTRTIEDALDMLRDGSKKPLANSEAFRRLAKGTGRTGALVWVGPDLPDELLELVPRRGQEEIRSAVRAMGLDEFEGLLSTGDYRTGKGLMRLGLREDGVLAKTFALVPTKESFASLVPEDAWFLGSVSVGDGKSAWERFSDYLCDVLRATGEIDGRKEFREGMEEVEKELGVAPGDVAAVVSDVGVYLAGKLDRPHFAFLFRVTDQKKAADLLERIGRPPRYARRPARTVEAAGQTIHVLERGFCYVALGDTICFGEDPESLVALAGATKSGKTLAKAKGYRSAVGKLPKAAGARLFYDLAGLFDALGEDATPLAKLLTKGEPGSPSLGVGIVVQTKGGTVEATTASPTSETIGRLFAKGMVNTLRDARDNARLVSDASNLKQLALGMLMYVDDYNESYPPDLSLICPYVGDTRTFRCPASRRPAPQDEAAIRRGDGDYVYLKPGRRVRDVRRPSEEPIMLTRPGLLAQESVNVAYADGHVSRHRIAALPALVREALEKHFGPEWLRRLHAGNGPQ